MNVKPYFAKRGMHFNGWAFQPPYSFRAWTEQQWKDYLDVLAMMDVNLFFLWPFMEIIPLPLSEADEAYLRECRRVVDYAKTRHGMEVWLMQCTNRVARDDCGVADPRRRPYWRPSQVDLNPAKPEDLDAILRSREAMYRLIDNADGIVNIDSDPGYCPGSPLADYLKVIRGCRALLDRHNPRAKMIHWMWFGWGRREGLEPEEIQASTIRLLKEQLPEPWELICGLPKYLPLCRRENVLQKTTLLPYNYIEGEPSYPFTNVKLDEELRTLRGMFAEYPELHGVMGNVQTPWLQLPHISYFLAGARDPATLDRSEREVLLDLAPKLYPDHVELIADCYTALNATDADAIDRLANRLAAILREGRLGTIGAIAGKSEDRAFVAKSLVMQLQYRAAQARLVAAMLDHATRESCETLIERLFDTYLAWDLAHGWNALWDASRWPLGNFAHFPRFPDAAKRLRTILGDESQTSQTLGMIAQRLSSKYPAAALDKNCIVAMKALLAAN